MNLGSPADRKATILVVDDEPAITGLLSRVLTLDGHSVHAASNGTEAIRLASEIRPDIIVMDITMPEMDGYEATSHIKHDPALKHTPVIFLTGKSAEEDAGRAFAKGGLTFVRKPFSNQQIRDLVSLTLDSIVAE